MTLVQAKSAIDAANQKHSAYRIEAAALERKIKEATVQIDELGQELKDTQTELDASEAALDKVKKKMDSINADPNSTDEQKAFALADYNKALTRVTEGKDLLSKISSDLAIAKKTIKDLENSEILKLVEESLKAVENAEAAYNREIEKRNSDSLAGDASSDYGLDPLKRYQNCQKLQSLLQKNVQVAGLGKSKVEYTRGILTDVESRLSYNSFQGPSDLLVAYFKLKWNGSLDTFEDIVGEARTLSDQTMKEERELLINSQDAKGRAIFQSNVEAYGSKYEGLFDTKLDDGMKAKSVDLESASYASREVEVSSSKNFLLPYYDAGYQTVVAGLDAWYKVSEESRATRDTLLKAYGEFKMAESALETVKKLDKKSYEDLKALLIKANGITEEAAIVKLNENDVYEPGSPESSAQMFSAQSAYDNAKAEYSTSSDLRNKILTSAKEDMADNQWLGAIRNTTDGYLRYIKADSDWSAITTNYEWVIVLDDRGAAYLSAKGSLEAFDQFKSILSGSKFAGVEANGESVLGKGVEEWVACQKFIADYEEKQEVTDTYTDVIQIALAGFGEEAQTERSALAKKLIEIPNANIAKALSQVKNIKFEDVAIAIKKAIQKGQYQCFIEGFVEATVLKHLIDQGYQVTEVLDNIDHVTGKAETVNIRGRGGVDVADVATKIAWDGAIADYKQAKDQKWYTFEWDKIENVA